MLSGIITFITFTFQSGYIQINIFWLNPRVYHHSLHSNMVIFKFRKVSVNVLSSVFFTFQYGYIQIEEIELLKSFMANFTFQYGYIQILRCATSIDSPTFFTFQYGYIQIDSMP